MKYWWIALLGLVLTVGCQPPAGDGGAEPEPLDDNTTSIVRVEDALV